MLAMTSVCVLAGCIGPIICVDYGAPNQRFLFKVTDAAGTPLSNAVLRASLSFDKRHRPPSRGLTANSKGEITFFAPRYFGPRRYETYIFEAPGYRSRKYGYFVATPRDQRVKEVIDYSRYGSHVVPRPRSAAGQEEEEVVVLERTIVLKKKGLLW